MIFRAAISGRCPRCNRDQELGFNGLCEDCQPPKPLDLDELERIGKAIGDDDFEVGIAPDEPSPTLLIRIGTLICGRFVFLTTSEAEAWGAFLLAARHQLLPMIDELRRLRAEVKQLREENNHFRKERDRVWYDG